MAEPYLSDLRDLLAATAPEAGLDATLTCKHFFSGAAAYFDGRIFASLTPVGLALKLPEPARDQLRELGAGSLRYFPNGPIKKDYVVVPEGLANDASALSPWIARSIASARAGDEIRKRRRG